VRENGRETRDEKTWKTHESSFFSGEWKPGFKCALKEGNLPGITTVAPADTSKHWQAEPSVSVQLLQLLQLAPGAPRLIPSSSSSHTTAPSSLRGSLSCAVAVRLLLACGCVLAARAAVPCHATARSSCSVAEGQTVAAATSSGQ